MIKTIYVLEDEVDMLNFFQFILTEEKYKTKCFSKGEDLLKQVYTEKPDLILLDLMLPDISGFEVCRLLKTDSDTWNIPIIVISSRKEEFDIISGINLGCDDYITKPFSEKILLAKIKSILNKNERDSLRKYEILQYKDLLIDEGRFEVSVKNKLISLTPTEFKLLSFLVKNKERVHSRVQISDNIYDYYEDSDSSERTIDILVARIRKKLGDYGKYIESIYGVGYRFSEEF